MTTSLYSGRGFERLRRSVLAQAELGLRQGLLWLVGVIQRERVNKPRTGPAPKTKRRWSKRKQAWAKRKVLNRDRASGLPQYPAVLSVDSGHGRRMIKSSTERVDGGVRGSIGTFGVKTDEGKSFNYMAYWEIVGESPSKPTPKQWYRSYNRSWLRPALRDHWAKIMDYIRVGVHEGVAKAHEVH